VFLAANRNRPVGRTQLVDVIWPDQHPHEVETALNAILSKLRGVLKQAGWSLTDAAIDVRSGSSASAFLQLPGSTSKPREARSTKAKARCVRETEKYASPPRAS
jgi:DNA-binding SARP family transcriptional activator